ncbi:hypothetical protein [Acidovorax sp. K2F]|uniref:hypothetical protein n=1 Tax=Acidovorax sp. K2F TaxID=2978125 RepID=UPI0021B0BAC1|nr:hypothetical protein [Acidovorax sp. K2F]MCT6719806.1 hypothetical protein [Acidovorax sp. K2F]
MALSDQIEELAKKHGATSYRNRADTQHPAYGFTPAQLVNLLADFTAEVRKDDEALMRRLLEALESCSAVPHWPSFQPAITAARARLAPPPPAD